MPPNNIHKGKMFSRDIGEKEKRKLNARRNGGRSIWVGMGLFGMVGWTVTVPALLGAMTGRWLDKKYPVTFSWTLTLLITGLIAGCLIAGRWVKNENKKINKNEEADDE